MGSGGHTRVIKMIEMPRKPLIPMLTSALLLGVVTCATGQELGGTPITIAASKDCLGFPDGDAWLLSVNASGDAVLLASPRRVLTNFVVTSAQLLTLSDALDAERFFQLKDEYGECVADSNTDVLTIVRGHQAKTVRIHSLYNWVDTKDSRLIEAARAVRVLYLIRSWFDHPSITNERPFLQRVLAAAASTRSAQPTVRGNGKPAPPP